MDRKTYRETFDKLTFSPDFQARTQARCTSAPRQWNRRKHP